ncbi:CheR family methyltransferase [Thermospira aquatica]|uniref:protein-glutamate O-methyltransferase n=1 Tax=Thermospira aquatica TaxID=2828656 RepID=A0AAX3BB62_9SPIR|nr:protein-glutamate O-methyltransferase CheR [Thermospira aquatica]URA09516.1 protein-glutamate O-methyltransferase CheR [Thermospira aquatica]
MEIDVGVLKELASLVYEVSGIVFKDSNLTVLESRLRTRINEKHCSPREYIQILRTNDQELRDFVDFVTTNFTSFFRYPRHFEMLRTEILPKVVQKSSEKKITIWSAGCSTGEEPYSLAITLDIFLRENEMFDWEYAVIGSDISLQSLFVAKEGVFPEKAFTKVPEDLVQKYFVKTSKGYQIVPEIAKHIRFDYHNLIYDNGLRDIPVVFCRNVLIYFDLAVQLKVLENIHRAMRSGGFLFIGHSESLIRITNMFHPQSFSQGVVYVKS